MQDAHVKSIAENLHLECAALEASLLNGRENWKSIEPRACDTDEHSL